MQMQLSFDVRIPDGLLAANALLNEKPHQGVRSWNLALHQGIDERNSTAAIGIRASAQLNRIWPRYTGKERDTESGNDYFGARYYNSATGRFLSPDWSAKAEPVPYAKLDNPQSLNLYAYVGNNPLSRTDPTGHYVCSGSKEQCAQVQDGLTMARVAQEKLGADSKGGKAIGAVLKFYGAEGEKNGVGVGFKNLSTGTLAETGTGKNGSVNITFDLKQINSYNSGNALGGWVERAGTEIHEGTHGLDDKNRGRGPENRHEVLQTERNAWGNEANVYRGLGVDTRDHLSDPARIEEGAQGSTKEACKNGCEP
jgi:RHS repeat-associated protein